MGLFNQLKEWSNCLLTKILTNSIVFGCHSELISVREWDDVSSEGDTGWIEVSAVYNSGLAGSLTL